MRLKRPRPASPDQIRISREDDTAVIEYADPSIRGVHLRVGPALATMTDADVLELFNGMLEAQDEVAAGVDPTLTEIPPSLPQIEYHENSNQWVPRGQVLRCHIEDDAEGGTVIHIDDVELDLAAFGRMLQVFAGFGMRIAFVDEEEVTEEPEIVMREPDNCCIADYLTMDFPDYFVRRRRGFLTLFGLFRIDDEPVPTHFLLASRGASGSFRPACWGVA